MEKLGRSRAGGVRKVRTLGVAGALLLAGAALGDAAQEQPQSGNAAEPTPASTPAGATPMSATPANAPGTGAAPTGSTPANGSTPAGETPAGTPAPGAAAGGGAAGAERIVDPAQGITLEEAVAYAVRNNPRVGEAAALIREARGRQTQARAVRFPQAGVNNFIFRQGPVVPSPTGGNDAVPAWRYNYGVFLNQVLFDWGQRINAERAAREQVTAARYRQGETENDIRLVVGNSFYNVQRAQELVAVAQERVESTTEQLRVARARFESDIAPRFDVIRSEAELAAAQQELIQARNEGALAEATLNTALGREVTAPLVLRPTGPTDFQPPALQELRVEAAENRPALRALEAEIRSLERTIQSRRSENRPQVSLQGAYNRPNPGGFASTAYNYNAGLVMTFPFFDSGLTRGRVREAEGTRDARRHALQDQRLQIELDIRQAQLDVDEARQRIRAATVEQTSAREALRVAEVRYRSGVGTNVEVTDAQVAVARAGQNLANAQFDLLTALVRLEWATGTPVAGLTGITPLGGTNPGPGLPPRSRGEQVAPGKDAIRRGEPRDPGTPPGQPGAAPAVAPGAVGRQERGDRPSGGAQPAEAQPGGGTQPGGNAPPTQTPGATAPTPSRM